METVRLSESGALVKVWQSLAVAVLAAAAFAAFASPAHGSVPRGEAEGTAASGTVAVTDRVILLSYRDGQDLVQERFVHRQLTGTFAGIEVSVAHFVIHSDRSVTLRAESVCSCTVEGRFGTVTFLEKGVVSADGAVSIDRQTIDPTGGLAGLRAKLHITGPIAAPAQTYTGQYSFESED